MYFFPLLLLGLCLLIPFRSTCKLMTAGIHPPITINMTFLCMPAVSSWARYKLVFRLLSFHGRQWGTLHSGLFFSLTTLLCWAYPMWSFCVFGCSLSWCHPRQSQFIASPFGQRHQRDNSATAPRLGKNTPPRPHSVALALFSWIISSAIVNISWILSSLTSLSILTQHSPVLVRSSPLAFTRSVMFCLSSSDVYL